MGLLDKAEKTQVKNRFQEKNNSETYSQILLKKVLSLKPTIDYGANLFHLLIKEFELSKAVLFYKKENNLFLNLYSIGYDVTTNNRLRLNRNFFSNSEIQESLKRKEPFSITDFSCFKNYFSKREYGLIENIHIIPFISQNEMIAFLIITEWKNFIPDNWSEMLNLVSKKTSDILFKSRMALIESVEENHTGNTQTDIILKIKSKLENNLSESFYLIRMDLSSLIQTLSQTSDLTAANIKSEIVSVFKTMSGVEAELYELPLNRIVLIQNTSRIPDIDLFLHQLSASLPLLYTNLKETPDLEKSIFIFEEDSSLEDLLKDLI